MTSPVDHEGPELSLPRLELPDWLPRAVADEAKSIYDGILQNERQREDEPEPAKSHRSCRLTSLEQIKLLRRLASDKRMKSVWQELYRKRRGANEFLNPAVQVEIEIQFDPTKLPVLQDPKNQDLACRRFLRSAFSLAVEGSRLPKKDEINSLLKPYAKLAARLRQDAQSLASLGLYEFASDLEAMAIVCERNTNQPDIGTLYPIEKRSRGDPVLRAYIFRLSMECRETFRKWLPGTVATTAGVAFSKQIAGHNVRDMMRAITRRPAAAPKSESKRTKQSSGGGEETGSNAGDKWAGTEQRGWKTQLMYQLRNPRCTNEDMARSMASSSFSALCDQHAEDPNFDEEKAYGRCLDEAWRTVLDSTHRRLYRAPD